MFSRGDFQDFQYKTPHLHLSISGSLSSTGPPQDLSSHLLCLFIIDLDIKCTMSYVAKYGTDCQTK